jgi:hypothetical protein
MTKQCSAIVTGLFLTSLILGLPASVRADQQTNVRANCPLVGASFVANPPVVPSNVDKALFYRLAVAALPATSPDAAFADLWTFQVFARRNGAKLSELRMEYSCPGGRSLCSIVTSDVPDGAVGLSSQLIKLDRRLRPGVADAEAPYMIVLPGFAIANWTFAQADPVVKDMDFFTPDKVHPDFGDALVWLRQSCGRR